MRLRRGKAVNFKDWQRSGKWGCDATWIAAKPWGKDAFEAYVPSNGRSEWRLSTILSVSSASNRIKEPPGLGTQVAGFTQLRGLE